MAFRVTIRRYVMYLNAICASACDASVFIAGKRLLSLILPVSCVSFRRSVAPEMAVFAATDCRKMNAPALRTTANSCSCGLFGEFNLADWTSASLTPSGFSPSVGPITRKSAVFRVVAFRVRCRYIERLTASLANMIVPSPLSTS